MSKHRVCRPNGLWHLPHGIALLLAGSLLLVAGCGGDHAPDNAIEPDNRDPGPVDWFMGQTLYELHLRAFSSSGDLDGATQELDRLSDLGVANLVLAPIFPTGEPERPGELGNLYAVRDHEAVADEFGDLAALQRFVAAAHERGLGVLLDVVLPVAAVNHVQMDEHANWFRRDATGALTRKMPRWSGIADFDFDNAEVREYLEGTLKHWVRESGVDGFRCALATLAPDDFWQALILNLHEAHPDVVFVAESADPRSLELGFLAIYASGLKERIDECRMEDMAEPGLTEELWLALSATADLSGPNQTTVIYLEDHFSPRSSTLYRWPYVRGYAAFLMTVPGTPQLLMGQEIADRSPATPSEPWSVAWAEGNPDYLDLYTDVTRLRGSSAVLRRGSLERIHAEHPDVLVYTRSLDGEMMLCAVNLSDLRPTFRLPPDLAARPWHEWREGQFHPVAEASMQGELTVDPTGYRVWYSSERTPGSRP